MNRRSLLALLIMVLAGILFPFGWLGEQWPIFGTALGFVFSTAREHAVGHTVLFSLLGLLALAAFPRLREHLILYLCLLLMVALGQEGAQILHKQRPLDADDVRDVATDLVGITVALTWVRLRRPADRSQATDR